MPTKCPKPDLRSLSISPSPVAIIHQIRNGVEKTARRIVDPLNTRGGGTEGGGMYRRHRQLHVGSLGCSILPLLDQANVFDMTMVLMLPNIFESAVMGLL